jgi:outer membrane receptor for ferrienterochelin and colicins
MNLLALLTLAAGARAADDACDDADPDCETVVVTASRAEQTRASATAPVDVIDRARIEASGATTMDDVLRSIPGLQVSPTQGGLAVSMQGMDAEHTLILIDGRPLAGRVDGVVDLARISVNDVARVEILPGPASALYGSEALGGVVNIVTRRGGGDPRAELELRGGSRALLEGGARVEGGHGAVRGGLSAYRNAQDGWDADPRDPPTTGDDAMTWGARGWSRATPGTRLTLDADADYQQRETQGIEGTPAGALFDVRTLQESADAGVAAQWWNGGAATVTGRLAGALWRQQYLENQRGSDVQDAYQETVDRRVLSTLGWTWTPARHLLSAGIDGTFEGLESARLEDRTAERGRAAVYAQDDWTLRDFDPGGGTSSHEGTRVALSPGGRLDVDTQFGLHATPHLALRVDPRRDLTLRATLGRGYRAPEFKELYLSFDHASYGYTLEGNPELAPETSTGGTLDTRWTPIATLELRARGWWNEVTDLIDPALLAEGNAGAPATYGYVNRGRAVTRGGTAGVATRGPGRIGATLDYTRTDARDRADDSLLDGRAPHRVSGTLRVRPHDAVETQLVVDANSARPYTLDGVTGWAAAYVLLDARVAWTAPHGFTVEAGARNLLDARADTTLRLAPRTFYAGVRYVLARPSPADPPLDPPVAP